MSVKRTIAVVTGSRADYGLLRSVIHAIDAEEDLSLALIRTGTHDLPPAHTSTEVEAEFEVTAAVEMQRPDQIGRISDVIALGGGILRLGGELSVIEPDVVLVLGDRIEAFAAAAAGAVAGVRVAHMHGGDRAEGIADESLRHAITKLAHIHLPATEESAGRIIRMGEDPERVHVVGSSAIDGLKVIAPLDDELYEEYGRPEIVFLLHPTGRGDDEEHADGRRLLDIALGAGRVFALHPNHDPGRRGILRAVEETPGLIDRPHLRREHFIGLLRRARVIVGNSSAGLIECAAVPIRAVNVGPRQNGREKPGNVIDCPEWDSVAIESALRRALSDPAPAYDGRYGEGDAGPRTAELLASFDSDKHGLRKRNTY